MTPADGTRGRDQVPGELGGTAPAVGPGGPVPGAGLGGGGVPGSGLAGCREWRCGRLAWIMLVPARSARCLVPLAS
jgi:hypothetical protein